MKKPGRPFGTTGAYKRPEDKTKRVTFSLYEGEAEKIRDYIKSLRAEGLAKVLNNVLDDVIQQDYEKADPADKEFFEENFSKNLDRVKKAR